jgi:hypothetical protein
MKYVIILLSLLLSGSLYAGPNFKSGDHQIDRWLVNIDYVAQDDNAKAVRSIAKRFGIKEETLSLLRADWEYSVAELYALCAIAEALGLELDKVEKSYRDYSPDQLEAFLKVAGMPPYSDQFKQFKQRVQQGAPQEDLEANKNNIFKQKPKRP